MSLPVSDSRVTGLAELGTQYWNEIVRRKGRGCGRVRTVMVRGADSILHGVSRGDGDGKDKFKFTILLKISRMETYFPRRRLVLKLLMRMISVAVATTLLFTPQRTILPSRSLLVTY